MARQTRHGVFETNSSSTHALSVTDTPTYDAVLLPGAGGVLEVGTGEFGWDWESFHDAETKAEYCATYAHDRARRGDKGVALGQLAHVLREQTGAREVRFIESGDEYHPHGYIDHQSEDAPHELFADSKKMKLFIFSSKSALYTGTDNSKGPSHFPQETGREDWE